MTSSRGSSSRATGRNMSSMNQLLSLSPIAHERCEFSRRRLEAQRHLVIVVRRARLIGLRDPCQRSCPLESGTSRNHVDSSLQILATLLGCTARNEVCCPAIGTPGSLQLQLGRANPPTRCTTSNRRGLCVAPRRIHQRRPRTVQLCNGEPAQPSLHGRSG